MLEIAGLGDKHIFRGSVRLLLSSDHDEADMSRSIGAEVSKRT